MTIGTKILPFHADGGAALCFPPSPHSARESERGSTSFNEYISSTKTKAKVLVLTNAPSSFLEGSTRRPRPLSFLAFRAASAFGINDATASRLAGIAATRAFFITLQVNRAIRLHIAARQVRERARRVGGENLRGASFHLSDVLHAPRLSFALSQCFGTPTRRSGPNTASSCHLRTIATMLVRFCLGTHWYLLVACPQKLTGHWLFMPVM